MIYPNIILSIVILQDYRQIIEKSIKTIILIQIKLFFLIINCIHCLKFL